MVPLWCIVGLILSAVSVSILGASFSVFGLGALFSGAVIAVSAMASSLELAKFVLAAYLHQKWHDLNFFFRSYLLMAVVVLSVITSLGIFGFLSDAYQSASSIMESETIKLQALQTQQNNLRAEVARITASVNEIPITRISKRLQARTESEPVITDLNKQIDAVQAKINDASLHLLEVKKKVGPLIYISRAFNMDIDQVVKYLILVLVTVFDPLAICLVVATSEALNSRKKPEASDSSSTPSSSGDSSGDSSGAPPNNGEPQVIQMRFADDKDSNAV
jgi:hypothetical protein